MTSPRAGASVAGDAPPYGAETYGDRIAEIYDDLYEFPAQTAAAQPQPSVTP